jgi:hypothetical protein
METSSAGTPRDKKSYLTPTANLRRGLHTEAQNQTKCAAKTPPEASGSRATPRAPPRPRLGRGGSPQPTNGRPGHLTRTPRRNGTADHPQHIGGSRRPGAPWPSPAAQTSLRERSMVGSVHAGGRGDRAPRPRRRGALGSHRDIIGHHVLRWDTSRRSRALRGNAHTPRLNDPSTDPYRHTGGPSVSGPPGGRSTLCGARTRCGPQPVGRER